ncbi:hypothetical protein ciss_13590 [Carboxydothermus islandicus]|uniref:Uncharacterized protein n=1 Tax=Carboxydothermus islandicus TaxID=661089 RepID=A0A1L8D2K4_9THEO|nr:hypothetical protein [Carboxydothermus islandicus]GAV25426.1 hypothetical protein ciss_13590 [Carboxydothermus islandicus]
MKLEIFLFYISIIVGIIGIMLGIRVKYRWYWLAIFAFYNFSYLTGFSRLLFLSIVWILLSLTFGHSLGLITSFKKSVIASFLGLVLWVISSLLIDDYWLFLSVQKIYNLLGLY